MTRASINRLNLIATVTGSAVLFVASGAWSAADQPQAPVSIAAVETQAKARFESLDQDDDGVVSMQEFEAAQPACRMGGGHHARHQNHGAKGPQAERQTEQRGPGQKPCKRHPQRSPARRAAMDQEMFAILDADADGQLSRDEFAGARHPANRRLARQRAMFKQWDTDGNGELTLEEMPTPAKHLEAADTDGDGTVSKAEMHAYRQAQRQSKSD